MAVQINTNPQDVAAAANFLEQYLTDTIEDGDFGPGTALRDLTVGALASIFAFLRADAAQIREMQSLKTVEKSVTADEESRADAVAAILSNFFITPKEGTKSRGFAVGHSSQQVDIFIQSTHRFTRTTGIVFKVDADGTLFIPKSELVPVIDADGVVLDYEFRIPLIATKVGESHNIAPGLFSSFDRFSPYITRIDNPDRFVGGRGAETVNEILARAPTAISVRNLVNERSIQSVLMDTFPEIHALFAAGMGDPEMQRDRLVGISPNIALHVGGMVDVYPLLDMVETTFTGEVGGSFLRPDGVANIFRDANVNLTGVTPGDVLRISAGLPNVPAEFLIIEVRGVGSETEIVVSERAGFSVATDEAVPPTMVSYTIGRISPGYTDIVSDTGGVPFTTGMTSRYVNQTGHITLPGGPVLDILDVAIINPVPADAAYKHPLDGFVHFPNHVNDVPEETATPDSGLQFRTIIHNPTYAHSTLQWMEIQVGTDDNPSRFDGQNLRVRYRTLAGFSTIDSFVRSRRQRTSASHLLLRGHHPVSLSLALSYKLKNTAIAALNDSLIAQTIVDFINNFDTNISAIDVSAIEQLVRNTFPSISAVTPITISYSLLAPTGDLAQFETADEVLVNTAKQVSGPALDFISLGITDRTLRYIANTTDVSAVQVI